MKLSSNGCLYAVCSHSATDFDEKFDDTLVEKRVDFLDFLVLSEHPKKPVK